MAEISKDRERELKNVLAQIERDVCKGAIMRLGDRVEIDGISTGSLALDIALGGKGLPRGRIIEIYGHESSGKTSIALTTVANAQKAGGVAAYIDAEHALDPSWAKRLGVDLENLLVSQPNNAEEALRIAEMLISSNAVDIIVIDSVAALVPRGRGGRRDRRLARRPAGPAHEPGAAHAQPEDLQDAHEHDLHQPDPPEGRRLLRQPRHDDGRPGAEVLRLGPPGREEGRRRSRRATRASARRSRSRWSRTRSPRRSAPPSSS